MDTSRPRGVLWGLPLLVLGLSSACPASRQGAAPVSPGAEAGKTVSYRAGEPQSPRYGASAPFLGSGFEARVLALVGEVARDKGRSPPVADRATRLAAREICRAMPGRGPPPSALVEFALRGQGIVDPPPHMVIAFVPAGNEDGVLSQLAARFKTILGNRGFNRVGVGLVRPRHAPQKQRVLVAFLESRVRFEPIPRHLTRGQTAPLRFRITSGHRDVRLVMTAPGGKISQPPLTRSPGAYRGALRCARRGVYQIEVTGDGKFGVEVLANFPVHCQLRPPTAVSYALLGNLAGPIGGMEADVFSRTNEVRKQRGLPALRTRPPLAGVARAHSKDMLDNDFVGHVSPTTGRPTDRLRRQKISHLVVRENVARAYSPKEAMRELMNSPAHRDNILARDVSEIGVGVAVDRGSGNATPVLLVTQLFIKPAVPYDPSTALGDVLRIIRSSRRKAGLGPLKVDARLDAMASTYVAQSVKGETAAADSRLSSSLKTMGGRFQQVDGLKVRVQALELLGKAEELLRKKYTHLGIGVGKIDSEVMIFLLLATAR